MTPLKRGDRVTGQRRFYFDGAPVHGWPNPQYVGTVVRRNDHHGHEYVLVKFDSGRKETVRCDALELVP